MKDVTAKVLKQSKDYGKRANLNISRVDIYKNKVRNIYKYLGKKKMLVRIVDGATPIGFRYATAWEAMKITETFGKLYFLDIVFKNTGKAIVIKLTGEAPVRKEETDGGEGGKTGSTAS